MRVSRYPVRLAALALMLPVVLATSSTTAADPVRIEKDVAYLGPDRQEKETSTGWPRPARMPTSTTHRS